VIFLDINPIICVWSAARRTGKKRSDLPQELTEPTVFSKNFRDFAKWILNYPKTGKKKVLALHEQYPNKTFLQIKSRKELKKYLK